MVRERHKRDAIDIARGIDKALRGVANHLQLFGIRTREIEKQHEIERRVSGLKERDLLRHTVFENSEIFWRKRRWWRVCRKAEDADFQIDEIGVDANGLDLILCRR